MKALRLVTAAAAASAMMVGAQLQPALAQSATIEGVWTLPNKSGDYRAELCGKDGDRLCFTLVALHGTGDRERNRPYLNKMVVKEAKPAGKNRWKGSMTMLGHTASGTLVWPGGDTIKINACAYVVICDEIVLTRVQ